MLPLRVSLKPSPVGLGFLFFSLLPIACSFGEGVPLWVRGLVCVLCLGAVFAGLGKAVRNRNRVLVFCADGSVWIEPPAPGQRYSVELVAQSCVLGWVQATSWRLPSGRREHLCFVRDGLGVAEWRALRRQLRALANSYSKA